MTAKERDLKNRIKDLSRFEIWIKMFLFKSGIFMTYKLNKPARIEELFLIGLFRTGQVLRLTRVSSIIILIYFDNARIGPF